MVIKPPIADVTYSTETLAVTTVVVSALTGAMVFIFKLLMASKDEQLKSYKEIALEAVRNLELAANDKRMEQGRQMFPPLAPVVPEHSSPSSKDQRESAEIQTLRAKLVAAKLDLGLPVRTANDDEPTTGNQ